ncbi:MAG: DEAD/DEAH box helicase [Candidatus Woesearchaeota archaeon]|jgi:ATP-dependent RNA helicase DeaD
MEKFKQLGIIEPILKSIKDEGFTDPSVVQQESIPHIVAGKDVIAGSSTGSGKTLAFGCGIIQHAEKGKGIQAIVLTPTRELAEQITKTLKKFAKYKPLNIVDVYGGVSIVPQIDKLRSADVVVGTPGRVLDHIERRTINLSKVKVFVADEADRMFDMGFSHDVEQIIARCPKEGRQTLFFSATLCNEITHFAKKHMTNPVRIMAEAEVDPSKLKQVYYDVIDGLKFSTLVHLIKNEKTNLVMVFCNSRDSTDFVAKNLQRNGIEAEAIHGGLTQARRTHIMESFHTQKVYVLVCTDVAARGLDIKGVTHVYNYDIPKESKQYIHRIGRTARAGADGKAINILAPRDHDNFGRVLREFKNMDITKEATPFVERIETKHVERERESFGGGSRGRSSGGFGRGRSSGGPRRFGSSEGRRDGPRFESRPRARFGSSDGESRGPRSESRPPRSHDGPSRGPSRTHEGRSSGRSQGGGVPRSDWGQGRRTD